MSDLSGRVSRVDLGVCTILTPDGTAVRVHFPAGTDIAVGDVASWAPGDPPRLAGVEPRRGEFVRMSSGQETKRQVVAANVDTVFLVNALDAPVNLRRIERGLAIGWQGGATPVVVMTKSDLVEPHSLTDAMRAVGAVALGVDVFAVSASTGAGLDDVAAFLAPGQTVALLGLSGAGKSTLVNALAGEDVMATAEVRSDGKGRHTTTHRELIPLANGAFLIDTPGMRSLGLWDADDGVDRTFADVESLAPDCRFNDCAHESEPGCAVLAAVESGNLGADRLDAYRKLQRELLHVAMRQDHALRQAEARKWKAIHKDLRRMPPKR